MALSFHGPYTISPGQTCSISVDYMSKALSFGGDMIAKLSPKEASWNKISHEAGWNVVKTKANMGEFKPGTKVGSWLSSAGPTQYDIIFTNRPGARWTFKNSNIDLSLPFKDDDEFENKFVKGAYSHNGHTRWGVGTRQKPPSVLPGSTSTGAVTDEDMAALFVQTKDVIAKELDLPIKGANPLLDKQVYAKLAEQTGYKATEVKAKIDNYKASGKKLSALKKKVMNTSGPKLQPVAKVPEKAAKEVIKEVKQAPAPIIYEDKAVAEQYIIAKDKVVANSNGKWTLYSKSDVLDKAILDEVKTALPGLTDQQLKAGVANYIASGKKLSALKKDLVKNGKLKPEADTLKGGKKPTTPHLKPDPDPATPQPPAPKPEIPKPKDGSLESTPLDEITDEELGTIFNIVKSQQVFATSSPSQVFNALQKVLSEGQRTTGLGEFASKNLIGKKFRENDVLGLVRAFDKAGAKKFGVPNTNLYEKKLTDWIQSGEGKKYILNQKNLDELIKNQPDLPPDSDLFKIIDNNEARASAMDGRRISGTELNAVKTYTGSSYRQMNSSLRFGTDYGPTVARNNRNAKAGMQIFDRDVRLDRGTNPDNFGVETLEELWGLVGKTFIDKGFSSTSVGGRPAFGGQVHMVIQAPKGVARGLFVDDISLHRGENEMLLSAGTKYKILRVERISQYKMRVFCRVIGVE